MSNPGQAALTIVGTAVGAYFGQPQLGYTLGSLAGQAFFPTDLGTVSGPRLNDTNVQISTIGSPIALVYGTYAVSGNLIWSSGLVERVFRERQGGKGGPTQTTKTYHYYANCAVGICEGPIVGITRVWADAKLVYDSRVQQEGETDEAYSARQSQNTLFLLFATFYLGTETQEPDPTIQSFEGLTEVSGYRGLAYCVFNDFLLDDYGNRIPNFRFEVSTSITTDLQIFTEDGTWANPGSAGTVTITAIGGGGGGGSGAAGSGEFINGGQGGGGGGISIVPLLAQDLPASVPVVVGIGGTGAPGRTARGNGSDGGAATDSTFGAYVTGGGGGGGAAGILGSDPSVYVNGGSGTTSTGGTGLRRAGNNTIQGGGNGDNGLGAGGGGGGGTARPSPNTTRQPTAGGPAPGGDPAGGIAGLSSDSNAATVGLPAFADALYTGVGAGGGGGGFAAYYGFYGATGKRGGDGGPYGGGGGGGGGCGTQYVNLEPVSTTGAGANGSSGIVLASFVSQAYEEGGVGCVSLGQIVRDLCERAGLSSAQIDVSDLTECVYGYVVARPMAARDAISPLRTYGWFDCVESDGVLKWPTRGKASVADLVADDLGAFLSGDTRPTAVETARTQEVEIPRRLRVHYAQQDVNYEQGEQSSSRLAAGATEVRDIEVPVAMGGTKAKQIADVVLYDLWVSRNRYAITLDHSHVALEAGDAITAPIDGRQERVRIVSIDYSIPGLLRLQCVRDDDGVYISYAIGNDPIYIGAGSSVGSPGTADLVLLDLPALRDDDDDGGYYAAVQALGGTTWGGATLYRSSDGGTTYSQVAEILQQASMGRLELALPAGPTTIIDEGSELWVISDEEFESISEASLLAGLNAAAVGADGRWEILQFRDAEQVGSPPVWRLTGLLRGRRGTEWAVGTSQINDRFVLLDSAITRVSLNIAGIGANRLHKAVLAGTSIDDTEAVAFTGLGVALETFSPVHVSGVRDSGDLTITWIRRGRLGRELPDNSDIPLSEASESYEIDVLDGVTVVRTITAATQSATYTAAQQTSDFGSPQAQVTVRIYQLSATVGRGYPTEATI